MSVESSSVRRRQQNELSELQAEYAQKKKKYSREQEEDLDELRDFYTERKEETRDQGEAAVNHIRRTQDQSISLAKENRQKIIDRSEAQVKDLEATYRKKVTETQQQGQEQLANARENAKNKIAEIQNFQNQKVEKVREEAEHGIRNIKDKYNKDLHSTQDFTNRRLTQIKEGNQTSIKQEVEKGRNVKEKLQANQKKELDEIHQFGDKRISEQQNLQEKKLTRQEADYEKRFHKQHDHWESREKGLNDQYNKRIAQSKKAYENQLKDQYKQFDSTFKKNEEANRTSLKIQQNNLLKEQVELKKKFFKDSEKYVGKEEDPFYKLQERGNRLRENDDFYIIEAYVPAHEKDSIKVTIKDDTASITGKRAFKDEIREEGRRLATSSFQSFREDFSFEKPVITEAMTRERDGDYITFWVPKLNSFEGIKKLNKKV